jgi:hypothetical protein
MFDIFRRAPGSVISGEKAFQLIAINRDSTLANANFKQLLFPVPSKTSDLEAMDLQFNRQYGTNYTLAQLDPDGLNLGYATPQIDNQTGERVRTCLR